MAADQRPTASDQHSLLDALPDPAVVIDAVGRVERVNAAARALKAFADAEGRSVFELPAVRESMIGQRLLGAMGAERAVRFRTSLPFDETHTVFETAIVAYGEGLLITLHAAEAPPDGTDLMSARVSRGLIEAGLALSSALSLEHVLQVLVDVSRELLDARYAALGVVNAERTGLAEFITSGLTPEQRARMGHLPFGHGILGLLIRDARPIRLKDLRDHPASAGVPRHHPKMRSFLGVPVMAKDRVFGNLYLTEKIGAEEFSDADLALVKTLAAQAAVAIENAQLRRERDRFFAAASHELGNAVTGVKVWARLLSTRPPDDRAELVTGLRQILSGAEHADRLIVDLLSLSKLREGKLTLGGREVDLCTIAAAAVEQFQPEAELGGIELILTVPEDPVVVHTDPVRVRQILVNLIANAVKFTPAGAEVRVAVERLPDGHGALVVSDQGPGISPEDAARLFQPYEQVLGVAQGRGTGLGLSLSRQIARLMGGELTVSSEPGQGAVFRLELPVELPEQE